MSLKVKDVMSTDIKSLSPGVNALEALKVLINTGMSGLPVLEKDGSLVGVFTEREILKAILPAYVKAVGAFIYANDSKAELKKIANLANFTIRDLMRKEVPTITEDSSLAEASKIMLTKGERRIMVVRDNKVVGVITRADVVTALARQAGVNL